MTLRSPEPGITSAIALFRSLPKGARIPDLITPTGKFNVYNTVHDIY